MDNLPWSEKYRPKRIEDVVTGVMSEKIPGDIIEKKAMKNMIVSGPSGTGKTAIVNCLARALTLKNFPEQVLELNASDDRGIKAVYETIFHFCKKMIPFHDDSIATFKIIILDEADHMTKKAQQLINSLMSEHSETTKFMFTCNESSNIIEAIQSKCVLFRIPKLSNDDIFQHLVRICKKEDIEFNKKSLKRLVEFAQGDMRKSINSLQLVHYGYGRIDDSSIDALCDRPRPSELFEVLKSCYDHDITSAIEKLTALRDKGYSESDLTLGFIEVLKYTKEFSEKVKMKYLNAIGKVAIVNKEVESSLQLSGCVASIYLLSLKGFK
jgi:replication factor C subunit 2/4